MTNNEALETTENLYTLNDLLESEEAQEIIGHLYSNDIDVIEAILELKIGGTYDPEKKETLYTLDDLQDATDQFENGYITYFRNMDDYYDYCDETLCFPKDNEILERYFDYDAFHRDCEYDVSEASNGVILGDW